MPVKGAIILVVSVLSWFFFIFGHQIFFVSAQTSTTRLSLTLSLHGIGTGGDNVSPGSGNINPRHPERTVRVDFYNATNQLVLSKTGTVYYVPSTGRFAGIIDLGSIESGTYRARLKVSQYLTKIVPGITTLTNGQTHQLANISLVTGDVNNDDRINILDFNIIQDCFSGLLPPRNCADSIKKLAADITDDGAVDQFDYNLYIREISVQIGDDIPPTIGIPVPTNTLGASTPTLTPRPTLVIPQNLIAPSNAELEAIGLLSVIARGADPRCNIDSTEAIQRTMNEAYEKNMVTFFPRGTYCISGTLVGKKLYDSNTSITKGFELAGSTMGSSVIRLKAGSPGFGNPNSPKSLVYIYNICNVPNGCGLNGRIPIGGDNRDNGFVQTVRDLEFEIEEGNAGAVAVQLWGAQNNSLISVRIRMKSGFAGIRGVAGANSSLVNIEVDGGRYGIIGGSNSVVASNYPSFANLKLYNQTEAAIFNPAPTSWFYAGLHIKKAAPPAIVTQSGSQYGGFTIVDGVIEFTNSSTNAAIDNSFNKGINLHNVYFKNAAAIIKHPNSVFTGGLGWKRIKEYGYAANGVNLLDGIVKTGEYSLPLTSETPILEIVNRHGISPNDFPSADVLLARIAAGDKSVVNVKDLGILPSAGGWESYGYGGGNNSSPDVTTKLTQVINSGAEIIFFPKGKYLISTTLELKEKTHLMGIANQYSGLIMANGWKPTVNNPAVMLRTMDSATASPKLSFMRVQYRTDPPYDYHHAVIIRSGKTVFLDTLVRPVLNNSTVNLAPNRRMIMTGNAGGKFYGLALGGNENRIQHPDYRHLLIENTFNPLLIYGANPEDHVFNNGQLGWGMEIKNSRNVAFLGTKTENHNTLIVSNSKNIALWALTNYDNVSVYNTTDVTGSLFPKNWWEEAQLNEVFNGQTVTIARDKIIGIFNRGNFAWENFFP